MLNNRRKFQYQHLLAPYNTHIICKLLLCNISTEFVIFMKQDAVERIPIRYK